MEENRPAPSMNQAEFRLALARERIRNSKDQKDFADKLDKFFSVYLYPPVPCSCQPGGAAPPSPTVPPKSSAVPASRTAPPPCYTDTVRCHVSLPITSLPPPSTVPAHHPQKPSLSDQQIPEHPRCPVCQRGRQSRTELVKYVNQAKKCAKFHLFPDDDPVTPKIPEHSPETHTHPSLPVSKGVSHPREELAVRSDGPGPRAEAAAPSSSTELGLQNLKISFQNKDCYHRSVSAPGTMSSPTPETSYSPSHSPFDWASSEGPTSECEN